MSSSSVFNIIYNNLVKTQEIFNKQNKSHTQKIRVNLLYGKILRESETNDTTKIDDVSKPPYLWMYDEKIDKRYYNVVLDRFQTLCMANKNESIKMHSFKRRKYSTNERRYDVVLNDDDNSSTYEMYGIKDVFSVADYSYNHPRENGTLDIRVLAENITKVESIKPELQYDLILGKLYFIIFISILNFTPQNNRLHRFV